MFTIGKLAKLTNSNVETIRYYQRIGLIKIPQPTGSYRYYTQEDIETIHFIQKAKDAGLQLSEIQELLALDINDREKVRQVIEHRLEQINLRLQELNSFKQQLTSWLDECKTSPHSCCPILESLKK
jgi:MerR family transcriptional regulator, mercuric resistance operon regulatory protein